MAHAVRIRCMCLPYIVHWNICVPTTSFLSTDIIYKLCFSFSLYICKCIISIASYIIYNCIDVNVNMYLKFKMIKKISMAGEEHALTHSLALTFELETPAPDMWESFLSLTKAWFQSDATQCHKCFSRCHKMPTTMLETVKSKLKSNKLTQYNVFTCTTHAVIWNIIIR